MRKNMTKAIFHCCQLMNKFLENPNFPLEYKSTMRKYRIVFNNNITRQGIKYCPWCGIKLPKNLTDEFYDTLENEYGIICISDLEENTNIPQEFKTDEWWKKRGL